MLEGSLQTKSDEQYPLLMVSGAGDATVRAPVTDSLLWNTIVPPRRPWSERWPEYLSTCWMTFILLGISFLVFYAVGIVVVYRNEAYILVKCNETMPASDVFYHSLVPRGTAFPLSNYADYLANVATLYPDLSFYVYFLIDDSKPSKNSLLEKLYPFYEEYTLNNRREVKYFQEKYLNVNITVMHLSKYMAMTPLKYRWRTIPKPYIPFYARMFAVWLNGGLGLDLPVLNQQYYSTKSQRIDRRTRALLKQHNDGITPEKYIATLDRIKREDETEFVSSFITMVQKMFNETFSMFNKTYAATSSTEKSSSNSIQSGVSPFSGSNLLVRNHRNKRTVDTNSSDDNSSLVVNIVLANTTVVNVTDDSNDDNIYQISPNKEHVTADTDDNSDSKSTATIDESDNGLTTSSLDVEKTRLETNKSEVPQIVLLYDFSVVSEPVRSDVYMSNASNLTSPLKFVTLDAEGSFISSTTRMHPFLGSILSAGCKRLPPKFAIQNALFTHCSGPFRDENYCNGIYIL